MSVRQTINAYMPRKSIKPNQRQTVDEDDEMGLASADHNDEDRDEYEQNLEEYNDVVTDTLDHGDD